MKHENPVINIFHLTVVFPLIYAVIFPQKLGNYKAIPRYVLAFLVTIAVIYHLIAVVNFYT